MFLVFSPTQRTTYNKTRILGWLEGFFEFVDDNALVGGFLLNMCLLEVVDEIMVFGEYIKKYARYGNDSKSEDGVNGIVFVTM